VVNEFLTKLREDGFLFFGHIDNVAIVARIFFVHSQSMHGCLENYRDLQNRDWHKDEVLMVNPSKTTNMIFRKYKLEARALEARTKN